MANCKPGDLAITHGLPVDNGVIVEVIGPYDNSGGWEYLGQCWLIESKGSPLWLTPTKRQQRIALPDFNLIPLRDSDGQDETFAWAGKPVKEPA